MPSAACRQLDSLRLHRLASLCYRRISRRRARVRLPVPVPNRPGMSRSPKRQRFEISRRPDSLENVPGKRPQWPAPTLTVGGPIEIPGAVAADAVDFLPIIATPTPAPAATAANNIIHFVLLLCLLSPGEALVTETAGSGFRISVEACKGGVTVTDGVEGVGFAIAGASNGGGTGRDTKATAGDSSCAAVCDTPAATAPMLTGASVC